MSEEPGQTTTVAFGDKEEVKIQFLEPTWPLNPDGLAPASLEEDPITQVVTEWTDSEGQWQQSLDGTLPLAGMSGGHLRFRAMRKSGLLSDPMPVAHVSPPTPAPPTLAPHPTRLPAIVAKAPNNHADRVLYRGLARKDEPGAWPINEHEGQRYYEESGRRVSYRPPEVFPPDWWATLRDDTLRALDKRFRAMRGDLVADVVDVLFLHWLQNGEPRKAGITLTQVLEYRGKEPTKTELELHWEAVRDARSIHLQDAAIDAALFDMDIGRGLQRSLFGWDTPPAADVIYIYSPGYFVGKAISASHSYLAAYTPKILGLDPYRDKLAKQIARYLRGEWRMNPGGYLPGEPPRYRAWSEHLKDAGIDAGGLFAGDPGKFINALKRELAKLYEAEALGDSPFDNPELYHPEDRDRNLPPRNRLPAFLAQRAHLPPIAEVQDELAKTKTRRIAWDAQQVALPKASKKRRRKPE